jgi:hypothetical protein
VLRFVGSGLSNREIASSLVLSSASTPCTATSRTSFASSRSLERRCGGVRDACRPDLIGGVSPRWGDERAPCFAEPSAVEPARNTTLQLVEPHRHPVSRLPARRLGGADDRLMIACTRAGLELISGKWKVDILFLLAAGVRRHAHVLDHLTRPGWGPLVRPQTQSVEHQPGHVRC